jgi:hydrogenase maturation protease
VTDNESAISPRGTGARTIVLCLGNDVRSDDGVGWEVAAILTNEPPPGSVIRRSGLSGFYLLDELVGYERAIVVDAIKTGAHRPGTVLWFPLESIGTPDGPSPHAVGLPAVVRLGRQSGVDLPAAIDIVAIEVEDVNTIRIGLTQAVQAAIPAAVRAVHMLAARRVS